MKNMKAYLMAGAALACFGAAEPAHAQFAFGAGATFPAVAYRQAMDCFYSQAQGSPGKPGPYMKATHCPTFNSSGFGGIILYAPTGSGNGKLVLRTNNKTSITAPSASNPVPYTDSTLGYNDTTDYDGVQFAGSDDIIVSSDMDAWNSAGNYSTFGNLVQIPMLIGPVGIGFKGTDGTGALLNIANATPTGGSSGLNLSRNALCGIFSGHITKWNNSILKALNNNVQLGTGNITVVHRSDGSGTTFITTNALATQCQFEFGANNESDSTVVSYAFPWTERLSAPGFSVAHGANLMNWPDLGTDQNGVAIPNPGGGHFTSGNGSGGLVAVVGSTNGAIGYSSADYWLPIKSGGLPTANIQSQWDLTAGTGQFQPPTAAGAAIAMTSASPSFDSTTIANPLAWSLQGVVPNPVLPGSYPIAGFTWFEMYQCYQVHANGNDAFYWVRLFLDYFYGSPDAHNVLGDNGFSALPANWLTQVSNILTDPAIRPDRAGNGGCAGKVGAY